MSPFDPLNNRGSIFQTLSLLIVLGVIVGQITHLMSQRTRMMASRKEDAQYGPTLQAGIETFLNAYRIAEFQYIKAVTAANCVSGNPFYRALKEGSQCFGAGSISVFRCADYPAGTSCPLPEYDYALSGGGCTIGINPASADFTCKTSLPIKLVEMGKKAPAKAVNGAKMEVTLIAAIPDKQLVNFKIEMWQSENVTASLVRTFAIRAMLPNSAHLDADGYTKQQAAEAFANCFAVDWGLFGFLDIASGKCKTFSAQAAGNGLGFYKNRYFSLRPWDGQVVDLIESEKASAIAVNYLVDPEDGKVWIGGSKVKVFVPYDRDWLVNVDDITLIDDQIYYVAFMGDDAQLGTLWKSPTGWKRTVVCPIGAKGWGQAYAGVAASSWSTPLYSTATQVIKPKVRVAEFFLKTDAGDFIEVVVTAKGATGSENPDQMTFNCMIFKDATLQRSEYKRTYGFDRLADAKPYFIY